MTRRRACGLILILVGLVYLNSFPGAFHFDDFALLLDNPDVTATDFRYLGFLEQYGGRPLTLWTFHWNYRAAGRDPLLYHAVNVLLHGLAALAFFGAVGSLGVFGAGASDQKRSEEAPAMTPALTAALIFALHPLQTQTVNYIWSRSALLMALFGFLSMAVIRRRPWLAMGLLQAAVWSRTEGLVFVPLLLWLAPGHRRALTLLGGVNLAAFAWGMARTAPSEVGWSHSDAASYWMSQPLALWKYVAMMFWPVGQTIDHDVAAGSWRVAAPALLVWGVLGWTALRWRRDFPAGVWGWVWVTLFLAPSGLVPNSDLFNESRAYAATGGFAIVAAGLLHRLPAAGRAGIPRLAVGAGLLLALAGLTLARNPIWNDDLLLWREAVRRSPEKARAHYNLGFALAQRSRIEAAEAAFRRARDLNPRDDLSYAALGYCAEVQERLEAAREFYRQALRLRPDNQYAREGAARVGSLPGREGIPGEGAEDTSIRPIGVRP